MAFKTLAIVFTLFVVVKSAPSPALCVCDEDEGYLEKIFEFYNSDIKVNSHAVVPGEISPLVYCGNCVENNRRKRKTDTETEKEDPEAPNVVANATEKTPRKLADSPENPEYVDYNDDSKPGVEDPLCPAETRRIGQWCA